MDVCPATQRMTGGNSAQDFCSSLNPAASLSADDQAVDDCRVTSSRLRPNAETIAAIEAARSGKVQAFSSINALLEDLDTPD